MSKLIGAVVAAISVLGAVSAAHAGYWAPGPWGPVYVQTCEWVWNGFGYVLGCG